MQRPPSIVLFERLYLASIAISVLSVALFWSGMQALVAAKLMAVPQFQANPGMISLVTGVMIGTAVLTTAVSVLFWWLVARQRSEVGKWLVVATEALGALSAIAGLLSLLRGTAPNPANAAFNLVAALLAIAAAAMLFRPDAAAWFGERRQPDYRP